MGNIPFIINVVIPFITPELKAHFTRELAPASACHFCLIWRIPSMFIYVACRCSDMPLRWCVLSDSGLEILAVQRVSKAQAWQRAGRAGREDSGLCYRLYTEAEFDKLIPMTVPEIQRLGWMSFFVHCHWLLEFSTVSTFLGQYDLETYLAPSAIDFIHRRMFCC